MLSYAVGASKAGVARNATICRRHASSTWVGLRAGCKRNRRQIESPALFQDVPSHTSIRNEMISLRQGRQLRNISHLTPSLSSPSLQAVNVLSYAAGGKSIVKNAEGGHAFQRIASATAQQQHLSDNASAKATRERIRAVKVLSDRLATMLSDRNLRHDRYIRSLLRDDQFLPLNSIVSLRRFAFDPEVVAEAIDVINSSRGSSRIHLEMEATNGGETLIKRSPPFDHAESIHKSCRKIMIVGGWPKGRKYRRAESALRSLLCNDPDDANRDVAAAYWKIDHNAGELNVEFESEEDAECAWENLRRASEGKSSPIRVAVNPQRSDPWERSYSLQIAEFALVARQIDVPEEIEEEKPSDGMDAATPESSSGVITQEVEETPEERLASDVAPAPPSLLDKYINLDPSEAISLSQFAHAMNELYQEHSVLPPPSREWLHEYVRRSKRHQRRTKDHEQQLAQRRDLCSAVANVVSCFEASIDQGNIRALGGKDGYLLSDSLGRAMLIYSETPHSFGESDDETSEAVSPYEACLDVLTILRRLNIDVHPSHFAYAVRAACHESRWEEAASLFLSQIDGESGNESVLSTGGFVPIDPTLGWDEPLAVGLYAVARNSASKMAENGGASPSKEGFDTAMKMCMVSPQNQDSYILAAGSALGHAGLWSDCLEFATNTSSISSYGPSIAAASMLACIESSRPIEAVEAYNYFMSGNQSAASEWQWAGGNVTAVKPLLRDLALHAMGDIRRGGHSRDAVQMFKEVIEEDSPLSVKALVGLAQSLERDGDWQSSMKLLKHFLESGYRSNKWRIVSDALKLNRSISADSEEALTRSEQNSLLANMLASVMRACNREGQFGLAILLCSIVDKSYVDIDQTEAADQDWTEWGDNKTVRAMLALPVVTENEGVLEAYIHSLLGLGCGHNLSKFLDESPIGRNVALPRGQKRVGAHPESWIGASVAINRVLKATDEMQATVSPEDRLLVERGLARAMLHCIDAHQPAAALHLFEYTTTALMRKDGSLADTVKLFFGFGNPDDGESGAMFQSDVPVDLRSLRPSDSLLAAIIKTYTKLGEPKKARSAFHAGTEHLDNPTLMSKSANNALEALLDIDVAECISFFDSMDERSVNPSTFLPLARHYAQNEQWPEVGELYNRARRAGCISEELGLTTMQAVCESEMVKGKIGVLRTIVDDISRFIGMDNSQWLSSAYWTIKRYVGFHHARLLMRWNDPATSQREELIFAVNEMRHCARQGTVVKNAVLDCIVRIAKVYGTDGRLEGQLNDKHRRASVKLVLEAWELAKRSSLGSKPWFTTEVARNLRALQANNECLEIALSLISPGGKSRHRGAMEEGLHAAVEAQDQDSFEFISNCLERSGYSSRGFYR